tara:strand:+ start:1269 stop:1589 length:321 start_codon:yes stop_codon:yes gene_type:complete
MAQKTKVFAPEGYHFMVTREGNFYLMTGAYTPHTLTNGDKSSEYVMMTYRTSHPTEMEGATTTTTTTRTATRTTARRTTPTTTRSTTTRSTSSGRSGGGYSGGGGY